MTDEDQADKELANRRIDYLVTALKGTVGALPLGSLVAEAVGVAIPRQRIDRMADVVQRVATKLHELETDVNRLQERFHKPEFTDFIEETMLQAGRAASAERREYLANMLVNGLTERDFTYSRLKKLLSLLQNLADEEIVILTYHNLSEPSNKAEFFKLHAQVLQRPADDPIVSQREQTDNIGLKEAWHRRLVELGLAVDERPKPEQITFIARTLLRYIGAPQDWDLE